MALDDGHGRSTPSGPRVWFLGDFDDPWVVALADGLPAPWPSRRLHCPNDLPGDPFGPMGPPEVIILHRAVLTAHDAERLRRWRSGSVEPRVILCHGPHARAVDLDRWSSLVDSAFPEATARESIVRQLGVVGPRDRRAESLAGRDRPRIVVLSGNFEIRRMLAEAVEATGHPVIEARDWAEVPPNIPTVWDVPVLEQGWADLLAAHARQGPILTLIGFADRELVRIARQQGAVACLELPFDLADLAVALERLSAPRPRIDPGHLLPPNPAARRRVEPSKRLAEPGRGS
jgi:CheY-like chemotaxis protein